MPLADPGPPLTAQAKAARAPVTLWIFNHEFRHISEQVEFFCSSLAQHGYSVHVSRRPNARTLNVVIENFTPSTAQTVEAFCRAHDKRVAVVQTEHLDFLHGRLLFHGVNLASRDDYIPRDTKIQRLTTLLAMRRHLRGFFRLGDLPRLRNFEQVLPGLPVHTIPFPRIRPSDRSFHTRDGSIPASFDLVFTGILTAHRHRLLSELGARFKTRIGGDAVSRRRRDAINAAGQLVLNLPQNKGWAWISTMRVLAALRCGRATVALGDFEDCVIKKFCTTVGSREPLVATLRALLERADEYFDRDIAAYNRFVASGENARFPHADFELWAALEL